MMCQKDIANWLWTQLVAKIGPVLGFYALVATGGVVRADDAITVTPSDTASIQQGIDTAAHQGRHRIVIAPGTYRLAAGTAHGFCLGFSNLHDLDIDATGVTFIFTDRTKGSVHFTSCKNVILRGATLLRDPLPFSQGKIIAVAPDGKSLDVRVDAGYPAEFDDPHFYSKLWLNSYNAATRQWQADLSRNSVPVQRLGPDSFRYFLPHPLGRDTPFTLGSAVAWRGNGSADIELDDCEGMKILDETIRGGIGFCVHENGGTGGNYFRYTVTYAAKPSGATYEPLLASNADAFHSSNVRKGPTLEDCHFEGMDDDGIPIHGSYALALAADGNQITVAVLNANFGQPGDSLRLLNERGVVVEDAKLVTIEALHDYQWVNPPHGFRLFEDLTQAHFFKITLDQNSAAKPAWLLANASACGNGFVVRRCTVRNNRARGMLIKAGDGLIEDCVLEGNSMCGLAICPEMGTWSESDFARNLVVRHNIFRRTGYWTQPGSSQCGALSVNAWEHKQYVPLPGGHRDILIEDNTFENDDGVNLVVSSAEGVIIRDNHFVQPMQNVNAKGKATGVDPESLMWLTECNGVQILGNTVTAAGPNLKHFITATPTATGTGFKDGVSTQ